MYDSEKLRLVTRSDFDGLVCAVLLKELDLLDEVLFVHPRAAQDGEIEITSRDITTNLPYVPSCRLAFDHHSSEIERLAGIIPKNHVIDPDAPSAARVVYEHFGGADNFPAVSEAMLAAVDKADSGNFTEEEVLRPDGWVLMSFLMDARTGLGRFREFRVSNYQLMMQLVDDCRRHGIDKILQLPDVKERADLYFEHTALAREQLARCAEIHDNAVVVDLREEETVYAANRFLIYAMYPQVNLSIHVLWGLAKKNTVFAIGNSIINRTSHTDVGALCLSHGGGGHRNAGTCQVDNHKADKLLRQLLKKIHRDALVPA